MNEPIETLPPGFPQSKWASKWAKHHALLERIVNGYTGMGGMGSNRINWVQANKDHPEWFQEMGVDVKDRRNTGSMGWYVRNKIHSKVKTKASPAKTKRAKKKVRDANQYIPHVEHAEVEGDSLVSHLAKEFAKITPASTSPLPTQGTKGTTASEVKLLLEVTIGVRVVTS